MTKPLQKTAIFRGSAIERPDGSEVELTTAFDKKRRIDTAYEIYVGLYQGISGPEERQKLFREFSPGFFDLIVIDECHRGVRRMIPRGARFSAAFRVPRKSASPQRRRKPSQA